MMNKSEDHSQGSWIASVAGAALFLVMGLVLIMPDGLPDAIRNAIYSRSWLLIVGLAVPVVGITIGWIHDFPRWSFAYGGFAVGESLFLAGVTTPNLKLFGVAIFGKDVWGWRAAFPLLLAGAASMLLTRSARPLVRVPRAIAADWTLLTFAMFGVMPLYVGFMLDDSTGLYTSFIRMSSTLIMAITAFAYIRAGRERIRSLVMIAGIVVIVAITTPLRIVEVIVGVMMAAILGSPAAMTFARGAKRELHAG